MSAVIRHSVFRHPEHSARLWPKRTHLLSPRNRWAIKFPASRLLIVAALTLLASQTWAADDLAAATNDAAAAHARIWLQKMSQALATRNYEGQFLHLVNGAAENMRIIHRVENGKVTERLVSLDGSGREVIRTDSEVTCYLPDRRIVLVEQRKDHGSLLSTVPNYSASLRANYVLAAPAVVRVLGRKAQLVTVQPRDNFRYGYKLWLDHDSAMPLKSELCDRDGHVLEQIVFSDLRLPKHIDDAALRTAISTDGFRWVRQDARARRPDQSHSQTFRGGVSDTPDATASGWVVVNPPAGFRLTITRMQNFAGALAPVQHMVFSDGIASVSVFIERTEQAPAPGSAASPQSSARVGAPAEITGTDAGELGLVRVGSAFAFTIELPRHRITAVGEAPANTVQAIAAAVHRESPDDKTPAQNSNAIPNATPNTIPRAVDANKPLTKSNALTR